jgi:hypothetical protein
MAADNDRSIRNRMIGERYSIRVWTHLINKWAQFLSSNYSYLFENTETQESLNCSIFWGDIWVRQSLGRNICMTNHVGCIMQIKEMYGNSVDFKYPRFFICVQFCQSRYLVLYIGNFCLCSRWFPHQEFHICWRRGYNMNSNQFYSFQITIVMILLVNFKCYVQFILKNITPIVCVGEGTGNLGFDECYQLLRFSKFQFPTRPLACQLKGSSATSPPELVGGFCTVFTNKCN